MKLCFRLLIVALVLAGAARQLCAQGTAFSYQGLLSESNSLVTGSYDFEFTAFNAATGGTQQGSIIMADAVAVSNGLFTVTLDFGAIYSGGKVWLNIMVRSNNTGSYIGLSPRQDMTPAPYASYAANAATVGKAGTFSGSFTGDMTGQQGSTAVAKVGGQSASAVASGAVAANAATSTDTPNAIVMRDSSGNFSAGVLTATQFTGRGGGFTNLNAANFTSGTLPASVFPPGAAQLGSNQTFTGVNTFDNTTVFAPGNGTLAVSNDSGIVPGIVASGGNAPGHFRFRNALEVWPSPNPTNSGYVDVRNTNGSATIVLNGQTGAMSATSFSGNGGGITGASVAALGGTEITSVSGEAGLSVGTNIYLNNNAMYLRNDQNHGLGYNGGTITNFPTSSVLPDGPVLWGYTGGALGQLNGGAAAALSWNDSGVTISNSLTTGGNTAIGGNLSVNNMNISGTLTSPGNGVANGIQVAYNTNGFYTVAIGGSNILGYFANTYPGPGYFVITASADMVASSDYYLQVYDVTSGAGVLVDQVFSTGIRDLDIPSTLTFVEPITASGPGTEVFEVVVACPLYPQQCLCYNNTGVVGGYNVSAMYFPRRND